MDHRIIGTSMPVLEFVLQPGETVLAQGGELSWKSGSVQLRQVARSAGAQGFMGVARRVIGGGSLFMTEYFAAEQAGRLAFATKVPGQILPLELADGSGYLIHRSGFLCGTNGVDLSVGFSQSMGVGLFGGEGFVLQRIAGAGTAWVELDGEVVTYDLEAGEVLEVSPGHVGLFEDTVDVSLTTIAGFKNVLLGGDGLFLVRLIGPGKVWLQSLPLPLLAGALAPYLSVGNETTTGQGNGRIGVAAAGVGTGAVVAQTEAGNFDSEPIAAEPDPITDQAPAPPDAQQPEQVAAAVEAEAAPSAPRAKTSSFFGAVGGLFKLGSSANSEGSSSGDNSQSQDSSYTQDSSDDS